VSPFDANEASQSSSKFTILDIHEHVIVADRMALAAQVDIAKMTLRALLDMGLDVHRYNRKKAQRLRRNRERLLATQQGEDHE